jgi:CHASE2 domain-containing sensor protein
VVTYARAQGTKAIGVDLLVPQSLCHLPDIALPGAPGDAPAMGRAVLRVGNVVLPQRRVEGGWLRPLKSWQLKYPNDAKRANTDLAFADLTEDGDQFVRRQQLLAQDDGEACPQFALALYAVAHRQPLSWDEAGRPLLGGRPVPVDSDDQPPLLWAPFILQGR